MSSFYNRPTSAQQPAFQFDRVYTSRKELNDNYATDGVMVGRYVLVTYGEVQPHPAYADIQNMSIRGWYHTFTRDNTGQAIYANQITQFQDGELYENMAATNLTTKYWYLKNYVWYRAANDDLTPNLAALSPSDPVYTYLTNLFIDIKADLVPCPNSVFIKLYSKDKQGAYYKEIASLNEYLPSMDLVIEAPTSTNYERNWSADERVDEQSLNAPFVYKTGLHYNIHMIQPAIFVPGSEGRYNAEGFSASEHVIESHSAAMAYQDGVYYETDRKRWFPYNSSSTNPGNTKESNEQKQRADRFRVESNFYKLGNAVATMWDKFYGAPAHTNDTTNNGITKTRGTRDTQVNTTYAQYRASQQPGATQGQQNMSDMRGIMNTILALVGYDERTTQNPNDYSEENCYLKTNNVIFDENGNLTYWNPDAQHPTPENPDVTDERLIKYNRDTLRGLIAEGAVNAEKISQLNETLTTARAMLLIMEELLGAEEDEDTHDKIYWPDQGTIHAIINYIVDVLGRAEELIGHEEDTTTDTLLGLYNILRTVDLPAVIDYIGITQDELPLPEGAKTIKEQITDLSNRIAALERVDSLWELDADNRLVPNDVATGGVYITKKLVANNTQNKVRGAMWSD